MSAPPKSATMVLALVLVMLPTVAPAQPEPSTTARAKQLHREGVANFKQGRIRQAIGDFERGHRLSGRPEFLLNLAQCYRGLGDRTRAIAYLQRFIAEAPDHRLRPSAEHTLAELRQVRGTGASGQTTAPPGPASATARPEARPDLVATAPQRPARRRDRSRTWRWVLIGVGVAAAVGAVIGGVYVATRDSELGDLGTLHLPPP